MNLPTDIALFFGFSAGLLAGWVSALLIVMYVVSHPKKK